MTQIPSEYKDIYSKVESKIDEVLRDLGSSSKESQLYDEFEKAIAILKPHSDKLKSEMRALEENAEWNTFVMAFYGETNAGKSTIIETLRIILKERSKLKERELFSGIQKKFNITDQRFGELNAAIEAAESLLLDTQVELLELEKNQLTAEREDQNSISSLKNEIEEKKKSASLWRKFIWLFKEMSEQDDLKKLEESVVKKQNIRQQEVVLSKKKSEQATRNKQLALDDLQKAEIEKKNLEQYADGNIIGNGKSDFTIKTQEYRFSAHDQEFILLLMLFFMLPVKLPLHKKEKMAKRVLLKKSKSTLIPRQKYGVFLISVSLIRSRLIKVYPLAMMNNKALVILIKKCPSNCKVITKGLLH